MANLDGCSIITNGNWNGLEFFSIFSSKATIAAALNLVATDWPKKSTVGCGFFSQIEGEVKNILETRFI